MAPPRFGLLQSRWLVCVVVTVFTTAAIGVRILFREAAKEERPDEHVTPVAKVDPDPELSALLAADGDDTVPPVDPAAVRLIDKLVEVSEEGSGTHSTALTDGFIAMRHSRFAGGVLGSEPPVDDSNMRDLVRIGVKAIPALLRHVSDDRKTRLVVGHRGIVTWASSGDEYDSRYLDPVRCPPGLNSGVWNRHVKSHAIRVGDFCYVALGQIVNRGLFAVRYQHTAGMIVNSPVVTPALAEAARRDWGGLTATKHRRLLIADSMQRWSPGPAVCRLCYYYSNVGEAVTVRLLTGPWHDPEPVRKFVVDTLLTERDPSHWRSLVERFTREHGPSSGAMVAAQLNKIRCEKPSFRDTEKDRGLRTRSREVLAAVFPDYVPERPTFMNAVADDRKAELIENLSGIRSGRIDEAVAKVYRSINPDWSGWSHRVYADDLALACIDRLIGNDLDAEFRSYCENRIHELEQRKVDPAELQRLERLREALARLQRGRPR